MLKYAAIFTAALVLNACSQRNVESSSERDRRELKARELTQLGGALLDHRWCGFVNSSESFQFRGFLRLTFQSNDLLTVEQYLEADGKPVASGTAADDKTGLWRLDGSAVSMKLDKTKSALFTATFGKQDGISTMTLADPKQSVLMWTCDHSVGDPMPTIQIPVDPDSQPPPPDDGGEDNPFPTTPGASTEAGPN
jgi:hypothetical protein